MHPIIYDVAVSIDGFISGPSGDVSQFPHQGQIVDDYQRRLTSYKTCLMGRKTYEFGYQYGMTAGQNPYPHMRSVVISQCMPALENSGVEILSRPSQDNIRNIAAQSDGDVYLCGGGELAGWMLDNRLIDQLRIKRVPILLGSGTPLFGTVEQSITLENTFSTKYENGALFQEFNIHY